MIPLYLPAFCHSAKPLVIEGICIHYFSARYADPERMFGVPTCWNLLIELNRPRPERGPLLAREPGGRDYASYHGFFDRDGNDYQLVPWEYQAYHAGVSEWRGRPHCNRWMVGFAALATHDSGYTDAQYDALIAACRKLRAKHPISLDNITGHEHVAPGRKSDPGPLFDWERLKTAL